MPSSSPTWAVRRSRREYRALSCDHLEYVSDDGIRAMAQAGTIAVLLPGAYYFLRETQLPPVQALRDAGVPIAIATDHNPGTSPTLSPLLMLNMACTLFRLTPEEAVRGMTVNGARALGLSDRGVLAPGKRADFVAWDVEHPNELAYWFGRNPCRQVVVAGNRSSAMSDDVFTLHRGIDAAARQRAACGHAHSRRARATASSTARSTSRTATGISTACTRSCATWARDCIVPTYSRYVIDLNRPPDDAPMYAGANNTELCPTRFFTGEPLYREGRAPDAAEVARRRERYWRPYHDALAAELDRLRAAHGHAIVFDGHSIKSELPWLFEGRLPDLNLGTANGASCAPSLRASLAARSRGAAHVHARRRRPLQGRLHHAPLRTARASAGMRCSSRCASRATWTSSRRSPTTMRACATPAPVLAKLVRNDDRVDGRAMANSAAQLWAPLAWVERRVARARAVLDRRRADTGRRSSRRAAIAPAGATVARRSRACPDW